MPELEIRIGWVYKCRNCHTLLSVGHRNPVTRTVANSALHKLADGQGGSEDPKLIIVHECTTKYRLGGAFADLIGWYQE